MKNVQSTWFLCLAIVAVLQALLKLDIDDHIKYLIDDLSSVLLLLSLVILILPNAIITIKDIKKGK